MRYLNVRLAGEDTLLHPLVPTLTDPDRFTDAKMVDWAPSFDPPRASVLLYLVGDLDAYEAVLEGTDLVLAYDVTRIRADRGYVYVHSEPHPTEWRLFELATGEGLIPVFPIQYHHDGSLTLRLLGPSARLQAAIEGVPAGVEATIEQVGEYDLGRPAIPPPLTDRQHAALETAFDAGYYAVPRRATRDEVAAALGCAPSTASEHLRKAERRLVRQYLDRPG